MDFEWDEAKSERNRTERGLPFGLAVELFQDFVIDQVDDRRNYGEPRIIAVGSVGAESWYAFIPIATACAGSSACATRTGESGMAIVRRSRADMDREKLLADLAARPQPSEEEIERWAAEDGGALTDEELERAVPVYPPPRPEDVRALRGRLGLSQTQFALMFGFSADTVQQYEQGRRVPSGPASSLLRVIAAEPEAVLRALDPRRARRHERAETPG